MSDELLGYDVFDDVSVLYSNQLLIQTTVEEG